MPTFALPNTQTGGIQYVDAPSLDAAKQQAQAAGTWSPAAGTYGANSSAPASVGDSSGSGSGSDDGSGGYYTEGQQAYTQNQLQAARDAATRAYQDALIQHQDDQLAFDKAREAFAEQLQQQQLGLDALRLSASLAGPRNAFQQQQVNYGLNAAGFSPLAGAIAGQYTLPTFQAPRATPQAASLGTLAQDVSQGTGFTNGGSGGAVNQDATQQFLDSLPNPNQIVAAQWNALPKDSQDFLLSAYQAKGFSANDVQDAIKAGLPTFKAPGFGGADEASN